MIGGAAGGGVHADPDVTGRAPPKTPKAGRQPIVDTQTENYGVSKRANARATNPAASHGLGRQANPERAERPVALCRRRWMRHPRPGPVGLPRRLDDPRWLPTGGEAPSRSHGAGSCPDLAHRGQAFGDMVDTSAGSRRSNVPRSSVRTRIAQRPSVGVDRKATGPPPGWSCRLWNDTQPPAWPFLVPRSSDG